MKRDINLFISDILESINLIEEYTKNITEEELSKNKLTQDAIVRRFEIIGEAVKNIPNNFRDKHTNIPWREIAGLRDVLIHGYFGVNLIRVWKVIKEDLPKLKKELLSIKI
jgi:uncharacterized protein with HEPN domain